MSMSTRFRKTRLALRLLFFMLPFMTGTGFAVLAPAVALAEVEDQSDPKAAGPSIPPVLFTAAEGHGAFAGIKLGLSNSTNREGRFGYGLEIGKINLIGIDGKIPFSGSIYVLSAEGSEDGYASRITNFGVAIGRPLTDVVPAPFHDLRAVVKLGLVDVSYAGRVPAEVREQTNFAVGLGLEHDWMISRQMSLGAEASGVWTLGPRSVSTLYVLANAKFWY